MERFLVRLVAVAPRTFLLKGGLALELRLDHARTTRDVDLRAIGSSDELSTILSLATTWRPDPEDHLQFRVEPNPDHPEIEAEWMQYDGLRFRVACMLAGKQFGDAFGIDVAYADPVEGVPDILVGSRFFERYGMEPLRVAAYPPTTHIAEKLHAYTQPRPHPTSRVKDLVDIAMLTQVEGLEASKIRSAIQRTFAFRGTHEPPSAVPDPPDTWRQMYERMQKEESLPWPTIDDLLSTSRSFLNPVLAGIDGRWEAADGRWSVSQSGQ